MATWKHALIAAAIVLFLSGCSHPVLDSYSKACKIKYQSELVTIGKVHARQLFWARATAKIRHFICGMNLRSEASSPELCLVSLI